jgi:ABC-2 type transport system permease protein
MAWILVRLKVRLLVNGLRGSGIRAVGFVLGCVYALVLGAIGFTVLVALRTTPGDLAVVAEIGGFILVLGWAGLPLLGFGSDETLDPTRLALLPLDRHQLMGGLLAASMVGPVPFGTALALAGGVVAFSPASPVAAVMVIAGLLELCLCVALSRAAVTSLSAALRSRKGRDLRIVLVALIGLLPEAARLLLLHNVHITDVTALRPAAHVVSWLPPVLPVRAMAAAGGGHWAAALLELAGGFATLAALLAWWSRALDSVMTTAETPPSSRDLAPAVALHARRGRQPLPLFDPGLDALPRTRTGVVAARELRYTWREPRRRVQLVSGMVIPFVLLAGVLSRGGLEQHRIVFSALLVAFLAGNNRAVNQFGLDGPAFWIHEAAGHDLRSDFGGKNLAVALTSFPLAVITAVVLAAISGGWPELAMTVCLAAAVVGILLGIGDVASILLPIPAPDSSANLWGTQGGQGCTTGLLSLTVLVVEAALVAPMVIAAITVHGAALRVAVVVGGMAYGASLYRVGLAVAERVGRDRGPELLEAISPRRAA